MNSWKRMKSDLILDEERGIMDLQGNLEVEKKK